MDNWHNFERTFTLWITDTTRVKGPYQHHPNVHCTYSNIIKFGRKGSITIESCIKKREKDLYKELGQRNCSVENFMLSMINWSIKDQSKKYFYNVCGYYFVESWVKPNNISKHIFWFCCWFLVYLKSTLNRLFFRASSYSQFVVLNISSLDKFFYSLSWIEFGIWFMKYGGWFDKLWM